MGSLLERLEEREEMARRRVEALRAEMDALSGRLAAEDALLERLEVTKTTVMELLADDGPDRPATAGASSAQGPATAVQVPFFAPEGEAAGQGLPVAYRDVVEVLTRAGVGLRASQVCQALGVGGESRHREGMRSKLKRLVGRGWLVEGSPGVFTPADGVAGTLNGADPGLGGDRRS